MSQTYHCPLCGAVPRRLSRNLDFFCVACHTAVAIIDAERAQVVSTHDSAPREVPASACMPLCLGRGRHEAPMSA